MQTDAVDIILPTGVAVDIISLYPGRYTGFSVGEQTFPSYRTRRHAYADRKQHNKVRMPDPYQGRLLYDRRLSIGANPAFTKKSFA